MIDKVFAEAAVEVCSYASPRDLVSLGLANRRMSVDVRSNLFHILDEQKEHWHWPRDGDGEEEGEDDNGGAAESVAIFYKHSYHKKEDMVRKLLEYVQEADLRYVPPMRFPIDTLAGTMSKVVEITGDESNWNEGEWKGTFVSAPDDSGLSALHMIACRHGEEPERGRRCDVDRVLRRSREPSASKDLASARDWARFILALDGVVGRSWSWRDKGREEAAGLMMLDTRSGKEVEILRRSSKGPGLGSVRIGEHGQDDFLHISEPCATY